MWWCQSKRISKEITVLLLFDSVLMLLPKSGHKREETEKRRNKGGGAGEKKKNVLQMLLVSYSTAILNACLLACLATKAEKSNIHFPRLLCI